MLHVLLIHADDIPHYRVPIYSYLSKYLKEYGFELTVLSDGIEPNNPHAIDFKFIEMPLSFFRLVPFLCRNKIDAIIDYIELRHLYLFPTYVIAKGILRLKTIYWGQGLDLLDSDAKIKNVAYATQQAMCEAIVLYAEHLKKYVPRRFHKKVFIANNTIVIDDGGLSDGTNKTDILSKYGIKTKKNIICVGRIQKRKRLEHLIEAFYLIRNEDMGVIFVGPDPEGILDRYKDEHIHILGPIYNEDKLKLLKASDVYCLPGAVGLSIVDAFHCGLPIITEEGDESAEIMYLKDGVNGFIVPRGEIKQMAERLQLLLSNDNLRADFSREAKKEISENGSMDKMCSGFRDALFHVTGQKKLNLNEH